MSTHAAVRAVLATLVRATADRRIPVVLRTRRPQQARDLARWLARAHGSERIVIASATAAGLIEVRLPHRLEWPDPGTHEESIAALPAVASDAHLSRMAHPSSPGGIR
ncbi:MAG: hypothetical protein H7099_18985 [Gemmatimonadaceae bacterium]|nr:hypothetical protein [Gemmatimonadaceae bacterium]